MAKRPSKSPAAKSGAAKPARSRAPREIELKPDPGAMRLRTPAPVALDAIIGQERAVAALRSSIASGRIHHAWIFHGPVGVGKFTTALAFASIILDPTTGPGLSGQIEPDPESPVQRLLQAGTHPDLHIVTKELAEVSRKDTVRDSKQRNISKEVLLEFLIEPAERTAVSGLRGAVSKVFIVDEAELVDRTGQNTLLKTLEEPPEGSVIILITSNEERILPTIRSRCQPIAFAPLLESDMKRWLDAAGLDFGAVDAAGRRWILSFADGSPGSAKLAVETGLAQWHTALAPMLAELDAGRFPLDLGATIAKLVDEWAVGAVERSGSDTASKDVANKAAARLMFRLLHGHYRARLREGAKGAGAAMDRALEAIERIQEAERQFEASVQGVFVFDSLATDMVVGVRQA